MLRAPGNKHAVIRKGKIETWRGRSCERQGPFSQRGAPRHRPADQAQNRAVSLGYVFSAPVLVRELAGKSPFFFPDSNREMRPFSRPMQQNPVETGNGDPRQGQDSAFPYLA